MKDGDRMAFDVEEVAFIRNIAECGKDKDILNHQIDIDLHSEPIQANRLGEISSSILKHIEDSSLRLKTISVSLG